MLQVGTLGCSNAQDRFEIEGWLGPVIGEMALTKDGKVLGSAGCRMGDTNALGLISNGF